MRFRRQPPALEPRPYRVPRPWNRPETEFPGLVPIDSLLFKHSNQAAIAVTGISAYTNGFEFAVTRLIQPEAPGWDGGLVPTAPRDWAPFTGPPRSVCSSPTVGRSSVRDRTMTLSRPGRCIGRRWRHFALPALALVGMAAAAQRNVGIYLRVADIRDRGNGRRHRCTTDPRRSPPKRQAMARRRRLTAAITAISPSTRAPRRTAAPVIRGKGAPCSPGPVRADVNLMIGGSLSRGWNGPTGSGSRGDRGAGAERRLPGRLAFTSQPGASS